jgi:hypothetical protein
MALFGDERSMASIHSIKKIHGVIENPKKIQLENKAVEGPISTSEAPAASHPLTSISYLTSLCYFSLPRELSLGISSLENWARNEW